MARGPQPVPPSPASKPFDELGLPYPRLSLFEESNGLAQTFPNPLAAVEAWQKTADYESWQKLRNMQDFTFTNALGYRFGIQSWAWACAPTRRRRCWAAPASGDLMAPCWLGLRKPMAPTNAGRSASWMIQAAT